jgi:NADH-quinone oxidoreductase subunit L
MMDSLFPPENFSLLALIVAFPLLGAFVNGVWGQQLGKRAVRFMALTAVGLSFVASVITFLALAKLVEHDKGEHVKLAWTAWEWMHTTGGHGNTEIPIQLKLSVDALSGVMMLVITGVGFLIHLYATSYMEDDPAFWKFFAYLNLFVFAMLVLVLADNLPVLFIGWEGVGLCSYLLIGFWYQELPNAAAGKKAFIANRIGDFGLICGMFLLVHYTGALDWTGIANGSGSLVSTVDLQRVHVWPIGGGEFRDIGFLPLHLLQPHAGNITISAATAIALMLFLGCTGKSAQIPLYVWLPDAMAGPTPVSALIHAATMVTAGVYLVCRLSFVFVLSPFTMTVIAITGAATALLAATIALVQNDIKKVLAYSTVSQLGFMFIGVGVGAFTAGFFHVFTHAFFKACLFLGAGSVIHAMHARIHDGVQSQDVRNMGGLRKYMPLTYWTFFASTLAIAGCPFTSGFFSKDEILYRAFVDHTVNPFRIAAYSDGGHWAAPNWVAPAVFIVGLLAAVMTAFYMFRVMFLTFHGDFRGWTIGRASMISHSEVSGHGHGEHHEDLTKPGHAPHESPWQMTVPLIVLGTCAIFAGFLNAPIIKIGGKPWEPMGKWLDPVFEDAVKAVGFRQPGEWAASMEWPLAACGISAFVIGTGVAYWMYIAQAGRPAKSLAEAMPGLHKLLMDKWRIDELYEVTVLAMVDALADTFAVFDQSVVDGLLPRLSSLIVVGLGTVLRVFQNGVVHVYAAFMVVGLAATGWFFVAPHADATVTVSDNGDYVVQASPGMGYSYQWDTNGDGTPDEKTFGNTQQVKVHLDPGKSQTVRLEVQNAFGLHGAKEIPITRPSAPLEVGQL